MATGTQVPWTTPGGTPCCCVDNCYTNLTTEPIPVYAAGKWQVITEQDYVALLAGGTYSVAVNVDVSSVSTGWFPGPPTRSETQAGSGIAALNYQPSNNGCHAKLSTSSANITINAGLEGSVGSYVVNNLQLYRSLATVDGVRYINLSSVDLVHGSWVSSMSIDSFFSSLVFGDLFAAILGNVSEADWVGASNNLKFVNASSQVSLTVNGNTYAQIGAVGGQFLSPGNMSRNNLNGTMSFAVTFTPSAP